MAEKKTEKTTKHIRVEEQSRTEARAYRDGVALAQRWGRDFRDELAKLKKSKMTKRA